MVCNDQEEADRKRFDEVDAEPMLQNSTGGVQHRLESVRIKRPENSDESDDHAGHRNMRASVGSNGSGKRYVRFGFRQPYLG